MVFVKLCVSKVINNRRNTTVTSVLDWFACQQLWYTATRENCINGNYLCSKLLAF